MPSDTNAGPRIFGIPATDAPIVAVIRRGPSDWCHVGKWDVGQDRYEPGSWFRGTLYPQKCDLSPDGRWLAYSAMKHPGDWPGGEIYEAVSRLPWLTALAAWNAGTTYTRGIHFTDRPGESVLGSPDVGDARPLLSRFGLDLYRPVQFAVERGRGWTETDDTPPVDSGGPWDEGRTVTMEKLQPDVAEPQLLQVAGSYAAFRSSPDQRDPATYSLRVGTEIRELDEVQWADWDLRGRLLVATADGHIQIRTLNDAGHALVFDEDLSVLTPDPQPPPEWATEW